MSEHLQLAIVRGSYCAGAGGVQVLQNGHRQPGAFLRVCARPQLVEEYEACLLYTSDAADDLLCVDLRGRRIIKKKIQ